MNVEDNFNSSNCYEFSCTEHFCLIVLKATYSQCFLYSNSGRFLDLPLPCPSPSDKHSHNLCLRRSAICVLSCLIHSSILNKVLLPGLGFALSTTLHPQISSPSSTVSPIKPNAIFSQYKSRISTGNVFLHANSLPLTLAGSSQAGVIPFLNKEKPSIIRPSTSFLDCPSKKISLGLGMNDQYLQNSSTVENEQICLILLDQSSAFSNCLCSQRTL